MSRNGCELLLTLIYLSGTVVAVIMLWVIFQSRRYHLPDKLLLFSIGITPLGKLVYLPIPGFYGLKVTFIVSIFSGIVWFVIRGFSHRAAKLLILCCVAGISLGWLEDPNWLGLYKYVEKAGFDAGNETGTTESAALRLLAFAFLILYSGSVSTAAKRQAELLSVMASYFVVSTIAASIIGVAIFIGVWFGSFTVEDLAPISVDSHILEGQVNFYRFNPGSNVNEFSMILAFAIFLLFFVTWRSWLVILVGSFFSLCMIATLTRSSWIGIVLGLSFAVLIASKNRSHFYAVTIGYAMLVLCVVTLYSISDDLRSLIDTRLAFDIGVSGDERLEKYSYVINRLSNDPLRLLFGYGWSTNLYVHSVFFQLLYEIGAVGTLIFFTVVAYFCRGLFSTPAGRYKIAIISALVFIAISAAMHHTLYHVQTWFMLGFISGYISVFTKDLK